MVLRPRRRAIILALLVMLAAATVVLSVCYFIGSRRLEDSARLKAELTGKVLTSLPEFGIRESIEEAFKRKYRTVSAIRTDITEQAVASSRSAYARKGDIRTRIAAEVTKVLVNPGDKVKVGQALAELFSESALPLLTQARLDLEVQQQRLSRLVDPEASRVNEYDLATLKLKVRQAGIQVELRRLELAKLTVSAPSPGRIVSYKVTVGDTASSGQVLVTLYDDSRMVVVASVPQADAPSISPGMKALVSLGSSFSPVYGKVTSTGYEGTLVGRSAVLPVSIEVDNTSGQLKSGMLANVAIYTGVETTVMASGTCSPGARVDVKSQTSGVVALRLVEEGAVVASGQPLVKLSNRTLDLAVEQAENELALAGIALDKFLSPAAAGEEPDVNAQALRVDQAQTLVESRQADLHSLTVRAPFDGVVTKVPVKPGDRLAAGATVLTVQDPTRVQVQVAVPEMYVSRIKQGQQADVVFETRPDLPYVGKIVSIDAEGQPKDKTATFDVTVEVDKAQDVLPGMVAEVTITIETKENVLAVPARLVQMSGLDRVVSVLREDKKDFWKRKIVQTVVVDTGITDGVLIEITCGLEDGDELIVPETK